MNLLRVMCFLFALCSFGEAYAREPLRVAVLDFENQAGALPSYVPASYLSTDSLAGKGAFILNKQLAGKDGISLVDRRDFFAQVENIDAGSSKQPSFLRAAQQVNADVVLRGTLLSLSSSRSAVHQGGYTAFLDDITVRVGLEALDPRDGSVIAAADGLASRRFRQTENTTTMLGEDDVLLLLEGALSEAVPGIRDALEARGEALMNQSAVKLTLTTSDDPALVEIDGILIGSTPLNDFEVYQGDHVITVGKAGYRDVTKRILLEGDTRIEIPLLKSELNADELKEVLEGARLNVYSGIEPAILIHTENNSED